MYKDSFSFFEQCLFVFGWYRYFEANPFIQMLVSIFCRQLICIKSWFRYFEANPFIQMLVSIFEDSLTQQELVSIFRGQFSEFTLLCIKTGFAILNNACLFLDGLDISKPTHSYRCWFQYFAGS